MYDLTIAVINKCFEFQNDWLKIIRISNNFVLYPCIDEIKNFEQQQIFLSDIHQNLNSTKLHKNATVDNVSSISAHEFLRYSVHKILETYIHIYRYFLKMIKSYSGHFKTCKPIENRMSKIFGNPIYFFLSI